MKTNYHTHSTWCDGKDSVEAISLAAVDAGFDVLGFSSHAMAPGCPLEWVVSAEKLPAYIQEVRTVALRLKDSIRILCGVEADYLEGLCNPDRANFPGVDYIIGSVHYVRAADGASVAVDESPEKLSLGISDHFGGSAEAFIKAYFAQEREMISSFDFDIIGHMDLVRKFNARHPYFDENAPWYLKELELTADVVAKSGKIVEINTGAISRGWLDDAYPSATFRDMLRARGVKFILNSDAHSADALSCAFDKFAQAEEYVRLS
jgi:histidinol-phosphatase (PHP family)